MDHELSVDLVLHSLPQSLSQFIMNYHMNKLDSTLSKLFNMFKTIEETLKKEKKNHVLLIHSSRISKKKNMSFISKAKKHIGGIKKDKGICRHCGKDGH